METEKQINKAKVRYRLIITDNLCFDLLDNGAVVVSNAPSVREMLLEEAKRRKENENRKAN